MLYPLASSSKGNATAILVNGLVIVVDAGISRRATMGRLCDLGLLNEKRTVPAALLLTHEHEDHAGYVEDWMRHTQPVFATCGTANKLKIQKEKPWRRARPFEPRNLGNGVVATPIMVPHDAVEPVAWRVAHGGRAAIVATDLGSFPPGWDLFCQGATEMLLEANYHPDLLASCDYLEPLKRRIAATNGHMSVLTVADWVREKLPATVERLARLLKLGVDALGQGASDSGASPAQGPLSHISQLVLSVGDTVLASSSFSDNSVLA